MKKLFVFLLVFLSMFITMSTSLIVSADNSADISYNDDMDDQPIVTDVLYDLSLDKNFNIDNYKEFTLEEFKSLDNDLSVQFLNITESKNGDLYIYTCQPIIDLDYICLSVNISLTRYNEDIDFNNYTLKLLCNNGIFYKYLVNDLKVDFRNDIRNYSITSIYRNYLEEIDELQDENNEINQKFISVSKCYVYTNDNGSYIGNCFDIETIEITDKFCGFIRYQPGISFNYSAVDSHYIAFDTDKPIDKLFRVKIHYTAHNTRYSAVGDKTISLSSYKDTIYVNNTEQVNFNSGGLFGRTFKFDRIQSVADFKKGVNGTSAYNYGVLTDALSPYYKLSAEDNESLNNKKWVINYLETKYWSEDIYTTNGIESFVTNTYTYATQLTNVSILELFFETDGEFYNLGVLDNMTAEKTTPSNDIVGNPTLKALLFAIAILTIIVVVWLFLNNLFLHIF